MRLIVIGVLLLPQLASACNCLVSRSACQETTTSNLVFIGTVDTIQPSVLDHWQPKERSSWMKDPNLVALRNSRSTSNLSKLKDRYLQIFFDLPASEKEHLQSAQTQEELERAVNGIVVQGTLVRFNVKGVFRRSEAEDENTDSQSKTAEAPVQGKKYEQDYLTTHKSIEVWNDAGTCGFPFQRGETYLVYAADDEETDRMETNICHRTARVSDAGEDLSYLIPDQEAGAALARLEGFVTSEFGQLVQDRLHYTGRVRSPVSNVVIELTSDRGTRYIEPDEGGRFVFDGLSPGDYQVSAFEGKSFLDRPEKVAGPRKVHVSTNGCTTMTFLVLTSH